MPLGGRLGAIREFQLVGGQGHADYLLKKCGNAAGTIEARKQEAALEVP